VRTADGERQALRLLHAGGFLHKAVEGRRLQRRGHRSDMQHARPNDGAGRGEGHAALDTPSGRSAHAATDTGVARRARGARASADKGGDLGN
jgi:hypothetical protein